MIDFKQLEREGRWAEIRQAGTAVLAGLEGDALSRAHLALSTAYFNTATGAVDFRLSLYHAHEGLRLATPGGLNHTWALGKIATLVIDMGMPCKVGPSATAYLKAAPAHPGLARLTPYVIRALGQSAYQRRQYLVAYLHHRKALAMFEARGDVDGATRTRLSLVWTLAHAGRPVEARSYLPASVPAHMLHLRNGAEAALLAAEGRWNDAEQAGKVALRGARLAHDFADAAEVCLILAQAAQRLGARFDALAFIREAADFAARQDQDASALPVLNLRAEGGVFSYAAVSRGSGGWHPDACFTTGIA